MLVDLVQVTTGDSVRLHGALELPATPNPSSPVDVWLCVHGTGSNFYAASTLAGIAPKLLSGGAAVLRGNTRGHDLLCTGPSAGGHSLLGAAVERVSEAPLDLKAWIGFLSERGYRRIGLLGHSLGAVKSILTLASDAPPAVTALVAVSPPHLSYERYCQSQHTGEFQETFAKAQQLVAAGRGDELMSIKFPIAYLVSAEGFLDRYGPHQRYDILRLVQRVPCRALFVYGTSEIQQHDAFRGMPEALSPLSTAAGKLEVAVVAGADHIYTGCHDSLAALIAKWLTRSFAS